MYLQMVPVFGSFWSKRRGKSKEYLAERLEMEGKADLTLPPQPTGHPHFQTHHCVTLLSIYTTSTSFTPSLA